MNRLRILYKDKNNNKSKTERNLKALFTLLTDKGYRWYRGNELLSDNEKSKELFNNTATNYSAIALYEDKKIANTNPKSYKIHLDMNYNSIKEIKEKIVEFEKNE